MACAMPSRYTARALPGTNLIQAYCLTGYIVLSIGLNDFNAICKVAIVKDSEGYTINKQTLYDCMYGNGKGTTKLGYIVSRKAEIAKLEAEKLAQDIINASLEREKEIQDRIAQAIAQHVQKSA